MRIARLPYCPDSSLLFEAVAREPWSAFLDSGRPGAQGGRWDILVARPYATLLTRGGITEIHDRYGIRRDASDPLDVLRRELGEAGEVMPPLPFVGGAVGYLAYDLGLRMLGLGNDSAAAMPEMAFGLYDWAVLVDHERRETVLASTLRDERTPAIWDGLVASFSSPVPETKGQFRTLGQPASNFSRESYGAAFDRVQRYIAEGDCYQINLTQRFSVPVEGDRWALYMALRAVNPAPFSAWLNPEGVTVMSSSPERFVELRGRHAVTRPIKGTRPRAPDAELDRRFADELVQSAKDKAENLMIVDLLRNDFGKVCRTGTVAVPDLFRLESFARVHHLVSTVTGELAQGLDSVDLLRATFPGGSITGAPKRRAMEIIDEVEPDARGVYCGAIGYLGFDGGMDTNVAIRTLVWQGGEASFGVGGGIVADSSAGAEYQECLDKAAPLLDLLRPRAAPG